MIEINNWNPADGLILEPNAEKAAKEQEKIQRYLLLNV